MNGWKEGVGRLGTPVRWWDGGPLVVLLPDADGPGRGVLQLGELLAARGYSVAIPDLSWRLPERGKSPIEAEELLGDGAAAADAGSWRELFPGKAPAMIGFGYGGLVARLAAASSPKVWAVVDLGGRLGYPQITEKKPAQPMDFLPGMRAPLQYHVGGADAAVTPLQVADLEKRLVGRGGSWQVFVYPGVDRAMDAAGGEGWDGEAARTSRARALAFLGHLVPEPSSIAGPRG